MAKITLVTGLWDIGRGELSDFKRSFEDYLDRFNQLLSVEVDFVVYVPKSLERHVLKTRGHKHNTTVVVKELEDFQTWFPFWDKVQSIRTSNEWLADQPSWLPQSPQARLEYYNPIIMSKMFMLNDAVLLDSSRSDYYFWIDGGLTGTVSKSMIDNVAYLGNFMQDKQDKFLFVNFPYGGDDIHGFERQALERLAQRKVTSIPRGGFFGGHKDTIRSMNGWYYQALQTSLNEQKMGTEESVFCIVDGLYSQKIHNYFIEGNGLVWPFFDHLASYQQHTYTDPRKQVKNFNSLRTALYILTYNSPKQVRWLLNSFEVADKNFLTKPDLFLIDNSTNPAVEEEYRLLCQQYNITRIKQNNIGICGARQLAAEHFEQNDYDYYLFFEDDMFLFPPAKAKCYVGFDVYTDNLFERSLEIIHHEQYDYLKLSYSEFYGSNSTQWAWYNISQQWREEYFPEKPILPREGLDSDPPQTAIHQVKTYGTLGYIEGEFHYCNWPLWFSRHGNRKVFTETKTEHLFEQRWMADTFYKQKQGEIRCAVLALSPINHNRFDFYPSHERKEC